MSKVHYHFDHVGSYLRPQALKEAREKFANGEISQEELLKVQDELVKELVHYEVEMGCLFFEKFKSFLMVNLVVLGGTLTSYGT